MSQNPNFHPDVLLGLRPSAPGVDVHPARPSPAPTQADLPLATPGIQRWVWHSRFGSMLIETAGEEVFVNGQRVQRHVG